MELTPTPFVNVLISDLPEGHERIFQISLKCIHSPATLRWRDPQLIVYFEFPLILAIYYLEDSTQLILF